MYDHNGAVSINYNSRVVISYIDVEKYGALYANNRNTFQIALYF